MGLVMRPPVSLRYKLTYAGRPAGEEALVLEAVRHGLRLTLTAEVTLPLPKTRQRWVSEMDPAGLPRRFVERVEGREARVFEVEFLREEGVVVGRGQGDVVLPYVVDYHDPLSLIYALSRFEGEYAMFHMVGGRAYAERLPDETLEMPWGAVAARVFRLRPGIGLVYFDSEGIPLRFTQRLGGHVFEARLERFERETPEPKPKGRRGRRRRRRR